ncbi:hypothetical protein ACP275_06G047400 [Erythranthe tilingii]
MTKKKSSVKLQKKLHELESELTDVFRLSLDPTDSDPRNQISFDDLNQRLCFLSRLVAAEAASQPPENAEQFRVLLQRIDAQKAAFLYWNESRARAQQNSDDTSSICSDFTQTPPPSLVHDGVRGLGFPISEAEIISGEKSPEKLLNSVGKDETRSQPQTSSARLYRTGPESPFRDWNESTTGALHNHDDSTSICSDCTHALHYDDDLRGSGSPISDRENVSGNEKSPNKLLDDSTVEDDNMNKKKEETAVAEAANEDKICGVMWKYCGVFGGGLILGAIFMANMFRSSSDHFVYEALLLPPT